jgi:hypothetical protein
VQTAFSDFFHNSLVKSLQLSPLALCGGLYIIIFFLIPQLKHVVCAERRNNTFFIFPPGESNRTNSLLAEGVLNKVEKIGEGS